MELIQFVGYFASLLMFCTFYMKKMVLLRAVGMCGNITFIIFAVFVQAWPLLIVHACLLPLNAYRMIQMIRLTRNVKDSYKGDLSMDFLTPFMKQESFKKGDVVFKINETADRMYCLKSGTVKLVELGITAPVGDVIGEIGILSIDKRRTATLLCETDAEFLSISDSHVLQLYYQNPEFGLHLLQLIIKRFFADMDLVGRAPELEST